MNETGHAAQQEKHSAAVTSVIAAFFQTGMKLVVGLLTGSIGILAEAAHSGFDLVAVVFTLFAVRLSNKPADSHHRYGHGKIENLSALFETILLLLTCAFILYEAIERLFFREIRIDASIWAFAVMIVSIAIDISRSRMLERAAKKFNSQSLEADAVHFSTDIWSSSVVLLGLVFVRLSELSPRLAFLHKADAVAAVGVAVIVIYISVQLGKRSLYALLDRAPAGMVQQVQATIMELPGIDDCHRVRVRPSGPGYFIDVHVIVDGRQSLDEAHALTEQIEAAVRGVVPGADVTVHPEPRPPAGQTHADMA